MRKSIALLLAVMMIAAVLTGCGSSATATPAATAAPAAADTAAPAAPAEPEKKVLTIGATADVQTLDPGNQMHTVTSALFDNIGSQLYTHDLDFNIVGDLATGYTQIDDLTWEFTMRDDAVFSNGDKITSADVQWSLMRIATDESLVAYANFNCIEAVEITGDYSFRIITKTPRPDMISLLVMPRATILPSAYIEANGGIEAYINNPVFSGPYMLAERVADDHYTLVPNPDYYGDDKATWDEVTYRVIPETSTRVSELLTGGVDVIDNVPVNEWDRVSNNTDGYGTTLAYGETSRVILIILKLADGHVTNDPAVREAMEYAINKTELCDVLLQGAGTPTRTRIGSSVFGCNLDLFGYENGDLYDPEHAKQILADAGYKAGDITVEFTASSGRYLMDAEIAQMIQYYLNEVGINVNLELIDGNVLSQRFSGKDINDAFMIGLSDGQYDGCYPLAQFCDPVRTTGMSEWTADGKNQNVVDLYKQTRVEMDQDVKIGLSKQLQQICADERPQIALCQMKNIFGVSNRVEFNGRMDSCIYPDEVTLVG